MPFNLLKNKDVDCHLLLEIYSNTIREFLEIKEEICNYLHLISCSTKKIKTGKYQSINIIKFIALEKIYEIYGKISV